MSHLLLVVPPVLEGHNQAGFSALPELTCTRTVIYTLLYSALSFQFHLYLLQMSLFTKNSRTLDNMYM